MTYRCVSCGDIHDGPPRSYQVAEPSGWDVTRDPESGVTGELGEEQAILQRKDELVGWFLRGNIEIPVQDGDNLVFTVWISLSEKSFRQVCDLWLDEDRVREPPYFGWVSVELPGYPSTLNLKSNVHSRPPGQRPWVKLEPTDHPLAVEQRTGITISRVEQLASQILHAAEPLDPGDA